jgi:hypothetical protein
MKGKRREKLLIGAMGLFLILAVMAGTAYALIPGTMSYQGYLADYTTGNPIDVTKEMSFSIWSSETGGTTPVWGPEDHLSVDVINGIFNVVLGLTDSMDPSELDGPCWLQVQVRDIGGSSWETLSPRQRVTGAPYAVLAQSVDGYPADSLFALNENETVTGQPSFNGGDGGTAPFSVDSTYLVTNLNADLFDGLDSSAFMSASTDNWVNTTGDTMSGAYAGALLHVTNTGTGNGGYFKANYSTGRGVQGDTTNGRGVQGNATGDTGKGVYGYASDATGPGTNYGGWFQADGPNGRGVQGKAIGATGRGVYGEVTGGSNSVAVYGKYTGAAANAIAIYGESTPADAYGIGGRFVGGYMAVQGLITASGDSNYYGVYGDAGGSATGNKYGVYGKTTGGSGYNCGVLGDAGGTGTKYGVYGKTSGIGTNYAGYFWGKVHVTGILSKGGGSFRIDHPLDPENKYLNHSFVESPDMMNIYNGNVALDSNGQAVVKLPEWFEALNRDFRYQLTPIGAPGPNLYVAEEISDNTFRIAGGSPGMKVSWQVTGIRQDAFANANRVVVEEDKPDQEIGKYIHPQAFGFSKKRGIHYDRNLEMEEDSRARGMEHNEGYKVNHNENDF